MRTVGAMCAEPERTIELLVAGYLPPTQPCLQATIPLVVEPNSISSEAAYSGVSTNSLMKIYTWLEALSL